MAALGPWGGTARAADGASAVDPAMLGGTGWPPTTVCQHKLPPRTPATTENLAADGPYGFATRDFIFVDTSRPTPPNGPFPGAPNRILPTRVFHPTCLPPGTPLPARGVRVPVARGGPFPILGSAHGLTVRAENLALAGAHLATHGYIFVAPLFPLSRGDAPGGPTVGDVANQPGDLSFVMQQVAQLSGEDADLASAVDTFHRGILGHSQGGLTVLLGAYHPVLKIQNIQSAVAEAPLSCFIAPGLYGRSLPTLIMLGTADELTPADGPRRVFEQAPAPVTLVEMLGGTHSGFFNREEPFTVNSDTSLCEQLLSLDPTRSNAQIAETLNRGVSQPVVDFSLCGPPLCSQRFVQTMLARRQFMLTRAARLAHFEATLRGRVDAALFLITQFDRKNPDVTVMTRLRDNPPDDLPEAREPGNGMGELSSPSKR